MATTVTLLPISVPELLRRPPALPTLNRSLPSLAVPQTAAPEPATAQPAAPAQADTFTPSGIGLIGSGILGHVTTKGIQSALSGAPAAAGARFSEGFAAVTRGAMRSVGIATAISAGLSGIATGIMAATGRITKGQAVGGFVANTVSSAVSSAGAVMVGGAATAALGAIGVAGLPLTLAGIGLGIVGSLAVDSVFRKTGIAQSIYRGISNAIDH